MWICKNCNEAIDDQHSVCWKCGVDKAIGEMISSDKVILSSTSLIGLYPGLRVLGLLSIETFVGTDLFSQAFTGTSNFIGSTSKSYGFYIKEAKKEVINKIVQQALNAGANAIMGIKFDYENIGKGMLMVGVTATAVII